MSRGNVCIGLVLVMAGFIACSTGTPLAAAPPPKAEQQPAMIQFDKTVHFTGPDGAPVLASAEGYLVEQTTDAQLRLVPDKGGLPLLLSADTGTHDLEVSAPFPLILALNDDTRDVVLLLPDGTALDTRGFLSGVQPRDVVRLKRRYQLAYQLNPATGQIQFGDGVAGQRPLAAQSNTAIQYRLGAGALGNVGTSSSSGAELAMIELQSIVSQRQIALSLASNLLAAQNEPFHLGYNTDRPGGDYAQRMTVSPEACRTICSADGNCQAFTFLKPLAGASTGQCFLKRAVPTPVGHSCCISAKRKSATQEVLGNIR